MITKESTKRFAKDFYIDKNLMIDEIKRAISNKLTMPNYDKETDIIAVIGCSGGKDSAVAIALFQELIGKNKVIAVSMSIEDDNIISDESLAVKTSLKISNKNWIESRISIDVIKSFMTKGDLTLLESHKGSFKSFIKDKPYIINTIARLRMVKLYSIAANCTHGRVINTSNLSESIVGWCTKWGDTCGDIFPFANMTAHEVVLLGEALKVNPKLLYKIPDDGMAGKSDEDALGISYEALDRFIKRTLPANNIIEELANKQMMTSRDRELLTDDVVDKINNLSRKSAHKKYIKVFNSVYDNIYIHGSQLVTLLDNKVKKVIENLNN